MEYWFQEHYIEILGAVSGLLYLYFSINQKIWLWPLGIITSVFYIIVFYQSKFYADMGLNVYYVIISIYGWYNWIYGKKENAPELPVSQLKSVGWIYTIICILILWVILAFILLKLPLKIDLPPSDLPWWDAFTTGASIVATFLLARKIIDQWLLWIIIDAVSAGMYIYKKLYPTVILFAVYTTMAVIGYYQWKKSLNFSLNRIS